MVTDRKLSSLDRRSRISNSLEVKGGSAPTNEVSGISVSQKYQPKTPALVRARAIRRMRILSLGFVRGARRTFPLSERRGDCSICLHRGVHSFASPLRGWVIFARRSQDCASLVLGYFRPSLRDGMPGASIPSACEMHDVRRILVRGFPPIHDEAVDGWGTPAIFVRPSGTERLAPAQPRRVEHD
jgi:hypothetical protein